MRHTLLFAGLFFASSFTIAADMSGTWEITVQSQAGRTHSVFALTQRGDAITGEYQGQFGEAPVTGTIQGNDVALEVHTETQGVPIEIAYTGTFDGEKFTGKIVVAGFGEGTFVGVRK